MDLDQKFIELYEAHLEEEPAFCSTPGLSSSLKDKCTDAKKADRERDAKKKKTAMQKASDKVGAGRMMNDFDPTLKSEAKLKKRKDNGDKEFSFGISRKKENKRHGKGGYGREEVGEAINLKQLKKQYDKNEDENRHTENYLLLAKSFGSKSEVKKVQDIMKRNEKQGHTSKSDMDWMYKNINPYYDKIRNEETMKLEDTVKQVLETNKNDKSDDGDGLDAVQPKAVKKKFKDRKDKDIDNDGDVDDSDKFLHKRRKAVSKAIDKKESVKKETFSKLFSHIKSLMQGK